MTVEKGVRIIAGSFTLLGLTVDPLWWLSWLVGFMLIISALTGFCPAEWILRRLGLESCEGTK
ncbi:YgaP family membrane protein [Calderihabitans maritimus]|uniref:Inner membrane protein YgaP-like transmembrane domain-containing protein n=1 Tax=Calderihabitans maritimus TaxID=1246530 RepID=A0A1Z5HUC7_9FIRM|nr:DUF2892 domain-containing protein [Calderihabitans maritimus]GAW93139.1 hypothetical protein Anae109_3564 [Calderihabitans maritimus]